MSIQRNKNVLHSKTLKQENTEKSVKKNETLETTLKTKAGALFISEKQIIIIKIEQQRVKF